MASCTEKHNTVGHSIGRMLLRHGLREFFGQGLPQGLSLPFEELGLRQIAYRTENGGGYMADGYARVSKRPGVMIAQNGPAATLVVAPLAEALKSSIPLVVMLQEIPLKNEDRNAFQEFDHVRLFSACSKWTRRVHTADRVEDYVDQAFAVACSGRPGPVVLLFPNDMLGMPAEPEKRGIPLGHYPLDPVMPPLDAVRGVAERLLSSRNPVIVAGGRAIAKAAGKRHGFKAHSPRVEALAFGAYNKAFAPNRTEVDWLSASDNNVDAYIADPLCGQKASIGLFYEMLGGIRFISTPKNIASMNRNTPILFISGDKDPVGEMGKGVKRAYEAFRRAGVRDVELKLYKGLRHEILNEDCRAVVYNDLWSWIEKHL